MPNTCLFIIDPQKDFMPGGALGVPGADKDMKRLADFIKLNKDAINNIIVTLDSHHSVHISHPIWWVNKRGKHPEPFTTITKEDVIGTYPNWVCSSDSFQCMSEFYITELHNMGLSHTIWPPHCIIGSDGHSIDSTLLEALTEWEQNFNVVEYMSKGTNIYTEHFGAFSASVPIPGQADTLFNYGLLSILKRFDKVIIGGEASSHCVAETVLQMVEGLNEDEIKKIYYASDVCSPVEGCKEMEVEFISKIKDKGVNIITLEGLKI